MFCVKLSFSGRGVTSDHLMLITGIYAVGDGGDYRANSTVRATPLGGSCHPIMVVIIAQMNTCFTLKECTTVESGQNLREQGLFGESCDWIKHGGSPCQSM